MNSSVTEVALDNQALARAAALNAVLRRSDEAAPTQANDAVDLTRMSVLDRVQALAASIRQKSETIRGQLRDPASSAAKKLDENLSDLSGMIARLDVAGLEAMSVTLQAISDKGQANNEVTGARQETPQEAIHRMWGEIKEKENQIKQGIEAGVANGDINPDGDLYKDAMRKQAYADSLSYLAENDPRRIAAQRAAAEAQRALLVQAQQNAYARGDTAAAEGYGRNITQTTEVTTRLDSIQAANRENDRNVAERDGGVQARLATLPTTNPQSVVSVTPQPASTDNAAFAAFLAAGPAPTPQPAQGANVTNDQSGQLAVPAAPAQVAAVTPVKSAGNVIGG